MPSLIKFMTSPRLIWGMTGISFYFIGAKRTQEEYDKVYGEWARERFNEIQALKNENKDDKDIETKLTDTTKSYYDQSKFKFF